MKYCTRKEVKTASANQNAATFVYFLVAVTVNLRAIFVTLTCAFDYVVQVAAICTVELQWLEH